MRRPQLLAVLAVAVLAAGPAAADFLPSPPGVIVDLPTRPGVTVRYAAFAPDGPPRAIALLFVGGQGVLHIPGHTDPNWQYAGNFLSRSREYFRRRGLYVAVVDAPSDHSTGLIQNFRTGADHATDVAAVMADLRRRAPGVPLWLIGTSRGSISAANAAARLHGAAGPDGVVLTSSVTRPGGLRAPSRDTVLDVDLFAIRVPVLIVNHRQDACEFAAPADAPRILAGLVNAPRKEMMLVEGGGPPHGDPCEPFGWHGYPGLEGHVVNVIADWILAKKSE
jgi:alpha-beta hydrolase superfamily lysophospholipase